ncbi:MAG: response regulator [Bdellovibrio sp.]|nr:response regulator [Bdellovibrio sp.]
MKTLSVSSKHLMILLVFMMPFGFLFYQFFNEQSTKISTLEKQKSKIVFAQKKAKAVDELLSQRLMYNLNSQQQVQIDTQIKKELESFEKILLDSNLVFSANFYTYYMTQLAIVQMPELFLDLTSMIPQLEVSSYELRNSRQRLDEKLKLISLLSAQALNVQEPREVGKKRQIASIRTFLDRTFSYFEQFQPSSVTSVKKTLLLEKNELSNFWAQSLSEIEKDISFRYTQEKNERLKYSLIMCLILLAAISCTMSIFYDMSQRIKKLTHLTRYTDPKQLSIQTSDFGYDEIGQLAQSFNTMALTLKDSFQKIEAANNAKSLFLANVSHEIRTPISGILGMSGFMSETKLSPEQTGYLNIIKKSSDMLLILINDLLDLAKIESGKMSVEAISFSLNETLQDVYDCFYHQAEQKGIKLILSTPGLLNAVYLGDPFKIKQIIFNLVSNAIKFTDRGQVEIICEIKFNELKETGVLIGVRDQGIGISSDKLESLFQDFVQVDASTRRKFGGTGLGLSLSKKLARLMGGELSVNSTLGEGSEFILELDLLRSTEEVVKAAEVISPETEDLGVSFKILVAEDNQVNQLIIKKYLQKWQMDAFFVSNGQQVVSEMQQNPSYDLILMDCQMPEMDGFEAARLIKLNTPHVHIIALTANATSEDRKLCLNAGMDDFISKPIEPEQLYNLIKARKSVLAS